MSFEEMTWAVIGSEQQQDTSPVFFYYSEDIDSERFKPEIVWPSLTEMFKNNDQKEWPFNMKSGYIVLCNPAPIHTSRNSD